MNQFHLWEVLVEERERDMLQNLREQYLLRQARQMKSNPLPLHARVVVRVGTGLVGLGQHLQRRYDHLAACQSVWRPEEGFESRS